MTTVTAGPSERVRLGPTGLDLSHSPVRRAG